ncbi:RuBisCO large subunit C-terminal-like domain-containing protein [Streptomyces sp. NPDC001617]
MMVRYRITGDEADARAAVAHLCVEQTIEFPADLLRPDDPRRELIGREIELAPSGDGGWFADVSFAVSVTAFQLPQLLNMLFGNISMRPGVRLVDIEVPDALLEAFQGPRFGVAGLRRRLGAPDRPILATALKPMGTSVAELAAMAGDFAANGIDIIKDDHGLSDQPFGRFTRRVEACAAAVREASDTAIYLPSLNVPADRLFEAAEFAKEAGAQGLMVLPGLHGFDHMRALAESDLGMVIMAHPSMLGTYVASPDSGISHRLLFGTLARLAGADLVVFPAYGGRFSFTQAECRSIADALTAPLGGLRSALPAPAGGMTLDRLAEVAAFYGKDVAPLIGGELHRGDRVGNAREMRRSLA